jgi:hypothetical protein
MERLSEYNDIETVSLHYIKGNSKLYTRQNLKELIYNLPSDMVPLFAVVNFTNRASPMIFYDIQEFSSYIKLKTAFKCVNVN